MRNPFKKAPKSAGGAAARPERRAVSPEPPSPVPARPAPEPKHRRLIGVLTVPHQTEKAAAGSARGWYTFRVRPDASKITGRRAVEERYGVSVEKVRMLYRRSKAIRLGRINGRTPGFKKAMVRVKEGQSIEFT